MVMVMEVVVVVVVVIAVARRGSMATTAGTKVAVVAEVAKVANTIRGEAIRMGNQAVGSGRTAAVKTATAVMAKDGELATDGQSEEAWRWAAGDDACDDWSRSWVKHQFVGARTRRDDRQPEQGCFDSHALCILLHKGVEVLR